MPLPAPVPGTLPLSGYIPAHTDVGLSETLTTTDAVMAHVPVHLMRSVMEAVLTGDARAVVHVRNRLLAEVRSTRDVVAATVHRAAANAPSLPVGTGSTRREAGTANVQLIHTMSDGSKLAIFDTALNVGHYAVSTDNGLTWQPKGAMPAGTGVEAAFAIRMVGDALELFTTTAGTVNRTSIPFDTGLHQLGAASTKAFPTGLASIDAAAATFDGLRWHVAAFGQTGSGQQSLVTLRADDPALPYAKTLQPYSYLAADGADLLVLPGGACFVSLAERSRGRIELTPFTYAVAPERYTFSSPMPIETAYTYLLPGSPAEHSILSDSTGIITLLVAQGMEVATVRRAGGGSWGLKKALWTAGTTGSAAFTVIADTGDLWVHFTTTAQDPAGDLYTVKRSGGNWGQPAQVQAAVGFPTAWVSADPDGSTSIDLLYCTAQDGYDGQVRFAGLSGAAPPGLPTALSPSGNVDQMAPLVFTWVYRNLSLTNPQSAFQVRARYAGGGWFYDTGQTAGGAASFAYTGPAINPNTLVEWQVQTWDSLSNGGAGTASGWSPLGVFTLRLAGLVTIDSVTAESVPDTVPPTVLTGPQFGADVTWEQADGHAANSFQATVYAADQVTAVDQTDETPISPWLESGDTVTVPVTPVPGLVSGGNYYLGFALRDAATAIQSRSALWPMSTLWTAPGAASGITAEPDGNAGIMHVSWANPPEAAALLIERVPCYADGSQRKPPIVLWSGALRTTLGDPAPCNNLYFYRVTTVSAQGVAGAPLESPVVLLPPAFGMLPVWVTDIKRHDLTLPLGEMDTWDTTQQNMLRTVNRVVPKNRRTPLTNFAPSAYWQSGTQKWFIRGQYAGAGGSILGRDIVDRAVQMSRRSTRFHYRDPDELEFYVVMESFQRMVEQGVGWYLSMVLTEDRAPSFPFTLDA